jgi:hypothetical protein
MNPFAALPIDDRYAEFHKRYPALNLIGNTRMVEILCFKDEFPEVSCLREGGVRKSRRQPEGSSCATHAARSDDHREDR